MQKLNGKNKGITLIALIITIIVMLILVGVTINVALNGGLFQKAEYASEQMQIKADEEELLSAVVAAIGTDGKVSIPYLDDNLPAGWSGTGGIYTSLKGNTFTVDENGKITYTGKNTGGGNGPSAFSWGDVGLDNVDTSTEYIQNGIGENGDPGGSIITFSKDGKLKIINNGEVIIRIDATDPEKIVDGKIDAIEKINGVDANVKVTMNENNIDITVAGMGTFTCIKQEYDNETVYSNGEVLKRLGITNYTGAYTGTWTVIGTEGNKTKLVSTRNVATYTLGYEDPKATGANDLEKSIWSYKNTVNTLNEVAQEATGIASARSINVGDIEALVTIEKGADYENEYTYNYTNHKDQTFVNENGETVVIDSAEKEVTLKNTYYTDTLTEDEIGILANGYYWLASPCVHCYSYYADFRVHFMDYGMISYSYLFSSGGGTGSSSSGVRAVVSI